MNAVSVKFVDGARVHIISKTKVEVPAKKVSKAAQKRELAQKVGRGLRRYINAKRRPSDCIVTTF